MTDLASIPPPEYELTAPTTSRSYSQMEGVGAPAYENVEGHIEVTDDSDNN